MKKSTIVTSVASLLTFASVAVLPAFAVDTGGVQRRYEGQGYRDKSVSVTKPYNYKKSEDYSRFRGERERYNKGDRKDSDGYRNAGYGNNERRGGHDEYRWGHGKKDDRGGHNEYRWGRGKKDDCGGRQYGHSGEWDGGHKGGRYYASR